MILHAPVKQLTFAKGAERSAEHQNKLVAASGRQGSREPFVGHQFDLRELGSREQLDTYRLNGLRIHLVMYGY